MVKKFLIWFSLLFCIFVFTGCQEIKPQNRPELNSRFGVDKPKTSQVPFDPKVHGFGFENYGNESEVTNLTVDEMDRLFGDDVFEEDEDGEFYLSPVAEMWMDENNEGMDGGHCEGMAVLSLLFYSGLVNPSDFGNSVVNKLELEGNDSLSREIAYWFSTQMTSPTSENELRGNPSEIVEMLEKAFSGPADKNPQYSVGIYMADGSGGHAITPYGLKKAGKDRVDILVYDNNFPNMARAIEVDTKKETWRYFASTNPSEEESEYLGDADTQSLTLTPLQPRLGKQIPDFLGDAEFSDEEQYLSGKQGGPSKSKYGKKSKGEKGSFSTIYFEGNGHLLIEDDAGNMLGFDDEKFVKTIPGASYQYTRSIQNFWEDLVDPVYRVPAELDTYITITGVPLGYEDTAELTVFGKGFGIEITELDLTEDEEDYADFSPTGTWFSYQTNGDATPDLHMSFVTKEEDYKISLLDLDVDQESTIEMWVEWDLGRLAVTTSDNELTSIFDLVLVKKGNKGTQEFTYEGIELEPGEIGYIEFASWKGQGTPLDFWIDDDGDFDADEDYDYEDKS